MFIYRRLWFCAFCRPTEVGTGRPG
uniref:Uncharacterized protein n=1 Tax=Rhizophora mucronata TaxID=61149 RepID=A0A2P2LN08_RHIMU